jgi:lysozyme
MQRLLETLKRHEGVKYYVYRDHLGYETIGVGRCINRAVGLGLSPDEVEYLLINDVQRCIEELDGAFEWFKDLDEVRREAMINLCFNLGLTKLRKFVNALEAMKQRNYNKAATEFLNSKWANQVGERSREVAQMIRTGEAHAS